VFELFHHRRLVIPLALLYLSQGIPMGIAMDAMPTLLRHDGVSLRALAFLPLVGLPWVIKFLWAPFVDNHGFARLERRRSWIIPMQGVVLLCLLLLADMGGITANTAAWAVAFMVTASLASSTQDIATDGMAAEHAQGTLLTKINAIQVGGVMVGFFVGGAGALTLTGYLGQRAAFLLLACAPLASLCALTLLPTRDAATQPVSHNASLMRFFRRPRAFSLVSLTLLSAITAVSGFGLSKLFLTDAGWSLQAIGQLGMVSGGATVILGCGSAAWLIRRLGLYPAFCLGIACAALAALLWGAQTLQWLPIQTGWAWVSALLGSLATGITSVAIMTAGMRFAKQSNQAGTDVTAVQSTRDLGELLASSLLVTLTAHIGYAGSFLAVSVLAIIAFLVAYRLPHREP